MPSIIRFHELGGPEVLRFENVPSREPGAGEARVRVQAVGLNRAEVMYYHGRYLETPQLPSRIGYEVAGVVEAVGEGVDESWVGKQVSTVPGFSQNRYGSLGEEAIVPANSLAEYPANLTKVQAAAIWMQYLTAWGALVRIAGVKPGDFVSISAASSSVGLAAIEIARDAGATAIAVTRTSAKRDELLAQGAHHVIASTEEDYLARVNEITNGKGVQITFDPVGGPFVETLANGASQEGIIILYGVLAEEPTPFPLFAAFRKALTFRAYTLMEFTGTPTIFDAARRYVYERLADGRFTPKIAKTFEYKDTVEAYRFLESNQQIGKVVITVPE